MPESPILESTPPAWPPKLARRVLRWSREPGARLQVVAIWAFVAFLLLITRSEVAWIWFKVASCGALAFFLWPFVQGPYLLYTRHRFPLHPDFQLVPVSADASPQSHRISDLEKLGFSFAGRLVDASHRPNVAACIDIFVHAQNRDSAHLGQIFSGLNKHYLLVFKSRFEDGFAFETSNGRTPSSFKPDPNYQVFRFPQVQPTADLYRLHRRRKEQFVQSRLPTMADGEGEVAAFIERAQVAHQRHAQSGHCKLAPSGECYVYTWAGAIRHAWLHAWPIKRWRTMRIYRRADNMIRELGFRLHPMFGRLEEPKPPAAAS